MKRLLDDLSASFDLDQRVRGTRLGELIERIAVDLDRSPLPDWGTPGPAGEVASAGQGPVHLRYFPHLFPGMDEKLRLAHKLQYHLLPADLPEAAPVTLAAVLESFCHLSGDLFGWRLRADGTFLIWIADMAGHGLETGLASAVLKVILDELSDGGGVDDLAAEVNETFIPCVRPGGRMLFATGFFMTVGEDGSATYCSAGHPPALVIGGEGELRELAATSRPIGLFQDQSFPAEKIRLAPGETLFLYTDGLIELTPREGEQFGPERLRAFLRESRADPLTLTGSLYESIAAVHDLAKLDDDVTFVAARFHEG